MSKPTNRRVILKAVASFPLAFTLGMPLSAKASKANKTSDTNLAANPDANPDANRDANSGPNPKANPDANPNANLDTSSKPFTQTVQVETVHSSDNENCHSDGDSLIRPIAKFSKNAFPDEWSHVSFEVTRDGEPIPGYLLKLPDGNFIAYSSKCKKLGCKFRLYTDAGAILSQFGITVSHPVLACQCHGSVFTPGQVPERLAGPERAAPLQMAIRRCHDKICILS